MSLRCRSRKGRGGEGGKLRERGVGRGREGRKETSLSLGTGQYLSPGGGRSIFVVTSEHLPDPPVEYLVF